MPRRRYDGYWEGVNPANDSFILGASTGRAFAVLLIDCEEDRTLRAVLVGMLREADR